MRRLLQLILLFSGVFLANAAGAQTWEIGGFAGGSGYMGDLNTSRPYAISGLAYGAVFKRNFNPAFSLKASFLHGTVSAADRNSNGAFNRQRNLSFFSPVTEISLQMEYNFFNYVPSLSKKLWTPYLFAGLGETDFNPKARYNDEVYQLSLYGTEGQDPSSRYKTSALAIPVGAGVKYNIFGRWTLGAELGYRTAFTDYIDDVSGNYPDYTQLINSTAVALSDRSGELNGVYYGSTGTQRGDARRRDTYFFTGFSLTYTFITNKCPVVE